MDDFCKTVLQYEDDQVTDFPKQHTKESAEIEVGDDRKEPATIHYEIIGDGPEKVVFIAGFGTSCRSWYPNIAYFLKWYPDQFSFLILDNRGCGLSSSPRGVYTTSMMARDVFEVLQHIKWYNVHVVGISMGGMISLELAYLFHELETKAKEDKQVENVPHLLSLNVSVTHAGGTRAYVPFKGMRIFMKAMFTKDPKKKLSKVLELIFSPAFRESNVRTIDGSNKEVDIKLEDGQDPIAYGPMLEKMFAAPEMTQPILMTGVLGQLAAIQTHHVGEERLKKLKEWGVPITIATGTVDFLVRPENSHYLNEQLCAKEYVVWEGSGHGVNLEKYYDYNVLLERTVSHGIKYAKEQGFYKESAKETKKKEKQSRPRKDSIENENFLRKVESGIEEERRREEEIAQQTRAKEL